MVDRKISELTQATAAESADILPLVQGGTTKSVSVRALVAEGRVLNALRYGALADGSTNNSSVFTTIWNAASAGDTIYFPAGSGTYRTTSPLPIKDGVNIQGDAGAIVEYLKQSTGIMFDDGNTAMTFEARGITFRRSGDGTALSGATGSERYTFRQQHASSVWTFRDCTFDDDDWNITDGAIDALTAGIVDGTAKFFGCKVSGVGRGLFTNSGYVEFHGEINVAAKCLANHGGTAHLYGTLKATGAAGAAGTISTSGGTTFVNGDLIRETDALAAAIQNQGGSVFASGNIYSAGRGIFNDTGATLTDFDGNIYADALEALRCGAGELRAVGTFESQAGNIITTTAGTMRGAGLALAPIANTSDAGILVSGGEASFDGIVYTGGAPINISGGVLRFNGSLKNTSGNSGVAMSGGTLYLDGRIETEFHGISPTGTTAKTINIGALDIIILGANTARRGINYTSATNCTVNVNSLRIAVVAGASASISTTAANTQTITAGKLVSNVAVGADITVSAWTYAAP